MKVLFIVIAVLWLFWDADSWDVQVSGVTGDGWNIQYRIETVHTNTADTLILVIPVSLCLRGELISLRPPDSPIIPEFVG